MIRWKTCLHEAAHVVAASVLLNDERVAAVVFSGGGLAFIDVPDPLRTVDQALAIAAGTAAESLAETNAPPQAEPATAAAVRVDVPKERSAHAVLMSDLKAARPDAERIAAWCIMGHPNDPDRWKSRYVWIHHEASLFVRNHATEIVKIASRLYTGGIVTLNKET